jgi:TRAP-type C4-dicarboxylate transport system substrate-binding protein
MNQPRKIRWLIAHQPQELFVRTARAFSEELNKHCAGELEVEILTYPDYEAKYGLIPNLEAFDRIHDEDHKDGFNAFFDALFDGRIEMSQMQIANIGEFYSDFHALDMPFLWEDHDHVSSTLEGPIGQELCAKLGQKTPMTGLGFTYSGGYRVIGSNEPISGIDELQGLRIVVQHPMTLGTTIESMGGKAVPVNPGLWKKYDLINKGQADAVETTYLRFDGKYVLKTNHSMFMTSIVVSNQFWNTLTDKQKEAFQKAALYASRQEREWSVEDGKKFEREAEANGVTITDISEEDRQVLKKKSQMTYVKCKYAFEDETLISRIRKNLH